MRALPLLLWTGPAGAQVPCDTGPSADCDADGWSVEDGDCDDGDRTVRPGRDELCDDAVDNDCDGLFDEECDGGVGQGQLRGGGGCSGGENLGSWLLVAPFWLRRRR